MPVPPCQAVPCGGAALGTGGHSMPPTMSPGQHPGSARGDNHSWLCPPPLARGGIFAPRATPRWCDHTAPHGPAALGGPEGHQRGRGVIAPPALPRYSAVTGHAVAPSQPGCTVPDEDTARDGCQPQPALHRGGDWLRGAHPCAEHPALPGHPRGHLPWDIRHGASVRPHSNSVPPWLCPNGTLQCEPLRPCRHPGHTSLGMTMHPWALSRVPGHCHPPLGTAVCPWGCSQHCSGHGGGSDRTPLLSPRIPRQGPRCVSPGGSVPGPQPGHHIPAMAVTERLCPNVAQLSGCPGSVPLPWGQDPPA